MSLCGCAFGLLFPSSKCDEGQFSNTHCPEPPLTCLQMESCSVPYNLWTRGGGNEGRARVGPRMRRPQSNTHIHKCLYTHTPSHSSYTYTRPYTLIHTHTHMHTHRRKKYPYIFICTLESRQTDTYTCTSHTPFRFGSWLTLT